MSVVSGNAQGNSTASATSNVGQYAITANLDGLSADNYDFVASTTDGTLTIDKAILTVQAENQSRIYGDANPEFTQTITGFVNNEGMSVVSGNAQGNSTASATSNVGQYAITANLDGLSADNYDFVTENGTLTITPKELTLNGLTADNKTYDGNANATFSGGYLDGVLFNDDVNFAPVQGAFSDQNAGQNKNVTLETLTLVGDKAENYSLIQPDSPLTANIEKAILTVQAEDQTRTYGDNNPDFTQIITGFVNNEDMSVVSGNAQGNSAASATSNVGQYAITANLDGLSADNYDFVASTTDGTLTIDKAILTVLAENQSRIYGDANPEFTQTITGFVNNEGMSVVSGNAQSNSTASATSNVGQYAITANLDGLSADNYDFIAENGTLTIERKALTIDDLTADSKTYDGTTSAKLSGGQLNGVLFDDDVSFTGKGAFTDKNVGENKTVLLGEMSLSGAAAGNYELTQPDALATDIDRLASATWVGANSGNWFDPANWLNGAIPDLANVAQVHIPAGVTVYFDTTALGATGAAGVEAGVVQIDALLAANANLVQRNGALQLG